MNEASRRVDFAALNERVQRMTGDLLEVREGLRTLHGTGVAGGGLVVATVSGDATLLDLAIDPGVIDPDDPERLRALVIDAVNEANRSLAEERTRRMGGIVRQADELRAGFRPAD